MGNNLSEYIYQLQLLAFFAGYPLLYVLINFLATENQGKKSFLSKRWIEHLPSTYALLGALFIGLLLKNISPDFSLKNIAAQFPIPYLEVWGIMAVLFWIPALRKRPIFSLVHSLPFLFILFKDLLLQSFSHSGKIVIENDMKMYTISFLLNMVGLTIIYGLSYQLHYLRISEKAASN